MLRRSAQLFIASVCAAVAAIAPASAQAAITTTNVAVPAAEHHVLVDRSSGTPDVPFTVSGSSNASSAGDELDVRCYSRSATGTSTYYELQGDVATDDATGAWSVTLTDYPSDLDEAACRLVAVPENTDPTDLATLTGPRYYQATVNITRSGAGPHLGQPWAWELTAPQSGGINEFGEVSDCGLCNVKMVSGDLQRTAALGAFGEVFQGKSGDPFGANQGIKVDGKVALSSTFAKSSFASDGDNTAGFRPLQISFSVDSATGRVTATETQRFVRCVNGDQSVPAHPSCQAAGFTDTGVQLVRTLRTSDDGRRVDVEDTYTSTDGAAHTIGLLSLTQMSVGSPSWQFPWIAATHSVPAAGSSIVPPQSAPFTVNVRTQNGTPGSAQYPVVATVDDTTPTAMRFDAGTTTHLRTEYLRTVPATGSLVMRRTHITALDEASLVAETTKAADKQSPPVVAVTSPSSGAALVETPTVVTGTAVDNGGLTSVTVNGTAVTPGLGGVFTASLKLTSSATKITVAATDTAGNTTTVDVPITFRPLVFRGTNGKDLLVGNAFANTLHGLGGDDRLLCGAGGKDIALGGAGNDRLECVEAFAVAKQHADVANCGAGLKDYALVDPFDKVIGCETVLRQWIGSKQADRFRGTKANDAFSPGAGNDSVSCGGGRDTATLGAGNDLIVCTDAGTAKTKRANRDVINCGPGRDRAVVDRYDVVRGCERVTRR